MRRPRANPRGVVRRLTRLGVLLAFVAVLTPSAAVHPTTAYLASRESAKRVDFDEGVVWVLVLGSDARPGTDVLEGRSDAIQLIALDARSGRAAGIGVPRDAYVSLPGHGSGRINEALPRENPEYAASVVEDLVGVEPDYVLVVGFAGFEAVVGSVGTLPVRSDVTFDEDRFDLHVRKGVNRFGPSTALDYARARVALPGLDFQRSANQQALMLAGLRRLRAQEDRPGFLEAATLAAIEGLDTDVAPIELYRLTQAVTAVDPAKVTMCVIDGTPERVGPDDVVDVDEEQAQRLGEDADADATLRRGCEG